MQSLKGVYKRIWLGLFAAPVVYYAIGMIVSSSGSGISDISGESTHVLAVILGGVGAIHLFLGLFWFRFLMPAEKLERAKSRPAITASVFGVALVSAAFIESPSLLALVWTLVSGDSSILLPVVLVSMGALYYSRGKALQAFMYIEKKWQDGEGLSR